MRLPICSQLLKVFPLEEEKYEATLEAMLRIVKVAGYKRRK